jgi:monovalent cation/hydrogen antiporter
MNADLGLVGVLLAIVTAGSMVAARAVRVPSPVILLLAGVAASYIPGVPTLRPPPDLIFLGFLPPLVYHAAFFSSPRQLLDHIAPVALLAVGMVVATIFGVAVIAHAVGILPWAAAFALGTIVAPTDPVAATAVLRRMGAPIGLRTVLEGESLLNDGIALVAFSLAVAAASGGSTAPGHVALRVGEVVAGAVAVGVTVGWTVERIRRRLRDPSVEILVSLITPYASYLIADRINTSGVLAVVATGLWLGWRSAGLFLPRTRLQAATFWNLLVTLLNSALFLLVGLLFPHVVSDLSFASAWRLAGGTAAVLAATAVVRLAGVLAVGPFLQLPLGRWRGRQVGYGWRERLVIGWSGFRGAVSVAAALSVPIAVGSRPTVVYLTFIVVFGTLVIQGALLPTGLRLVGLERPAGPRRGELEARAEAARAAIDRLDEIERDHERPQEVLDALREAYDRRLEHLSALLDEEQDEEAGVVRRARARQELRADLLATQRRRIEELRNRGRISSEEMRRIIQELDLEDVSMREGGLGEL